MTSRSTDGRRGRGLLVAGLLGSALLAIGLLLAQAWDSVRTHREVAEAVLREHVQFAADRYVAVLNTEFQSAFYDALLSFQGWYPDDPLPSPDSAHLRSPSEAVPPGAVRYFLALDPVEETLRIRGDEPSREERRWVRSRVAGHAREVYPAPAPYAVLTDRLGGRDVTVVYRREGLPGEPRTRIFGFALDPTTFEALFREILDEAELLPPTVTREVAGDDLFSVSIRAPEGDVVFRSGDLERAAATSQRTTAGRSARMNVRLGLAPEHADALVAGGVPRFRLPVFGALVALTVVLMGGAVLLLRREAHLARLRQEFVASVSHELRTPLTQIRMFAETLMLERYRDEGDARKALETIDQESRRLSELVENVLSFSRLTSGGVRLTPEPTEMELLVRGVVEGFRPIARARGVTVEWRVDLDERPVLDGSAFRRILLNLLDNAVKYGDEGQTVRIRVERAGPSVRLTVDDDGPGVAPGDRNRIWERFSRATAEDAGVAGTGIGLSVVKELVELHGGQVVVADAPSGGARFMVELPAAGVPGPRGGHVVRTPDQPGALSEPARDPPVTSGSEP